MESDLTPCPSHSITGSVWVEEEEKGFTNFTAEPTGVKNFYNALLCHTALNLLILRYHHLVKVDPRLLKIFTVAIDVT